jgi:hypothetical protein
MSLLSRIVAAVAAVAVVGAAAVLFARGTPASTGYKAADVKVACAPSQRALVSQTMTGGTPQVEILCADVAGAAPTGYMIGGGGELVAAAYAPTAIARPAVYYPQAVAQQEPTPVRTPRVSRTSTAGTAPVRRVAQKPSWQKRALVIGGSAGAGAGIGALIGGKKGALIGAAIGGGGATILDQVKRR